MTKRKFTAVTLTKLRPGPEISDADCQGLRAKAYPSGKVSFLLRYRRPGSRKGAKVVLGWLDAHGGEETEGVLGGPLTLAQARIICSLARRDIARGIDPGLKKKEAKHAERLKVADTFEAVAREYVIRHCKNNGHRKWQNTAGALGFIVDKRTGEMNPEPKKGSLADRWRNTPASSITRKDVQRICDALIDQGKPYGALARWKTLRRCFKWSVDRAILEVSPLQDSKAPFKGTSRDRVLTDQEVRCLWKACATQGLFGEMVRLLLLTGCRRDECRGMRRTEIQGDTWTIPAARMKGKQEHVVFLSGAASKLLADMPMILSGDKPSPIVFTLNGRRIIGGLARLKRQVDKAMKIELAKENAELLPWRLHDLRRTMATNFQKMGIRFEVTEACLAHRGVSRSGVAGIYSRHDWADEKRQAWSAWADRLAGIVQGVATKTNVIALSR